MPRVVEGIGSKSTEKAVELYSRVSSKLVPTDATTAESAKLIENTYRDLNIAYANLLAIMAEKLGIVVYEAIKLANTYQPENIPHARSQSWRFCLTKDPYMLASLLPKFWEDRAN